MSKALKKAKAIFNQIAETCYELDNDELSEALIEMEKEVKEEYSVQAIQEFVDEITTHLNNIDVDPETMSDLDSLLAELLEI